MLQIQFAKIARCSITHPNRFSRIRTLSGWLALAVLLTQSAWGQFVIQGPKLGVKGVIFAVEAQASGKVILGGGFSDFNGDESSGLGLIRLTAGGAKDPLWDIGFVSGVRDTLMLGNFLYVAGQFNDVRTLSAGIVPRAYLFRMFLTGPNEGKVDTTWTPNVGGPVYHLATDGTSLFIGGNFTTVNGATRNRLAKITTGNVATPFAVDATWNPAPNGDIHALKYANSQLYVAGGFSSIGGVVNNYLARLSPTGTGAADPLWKPTFNNLVSSLESDATYIYVGGRFNIANSANRRALCRYTLAAGAPSLDGTWNPNADGEVNTMLKSGSALFIAGVFRNVGGQPRFLLAKVSDTAAGAVDPAFIPNPNGAVLDLKISSGALLCGGRFSTTVGTASSAYALLNTTTGSASAAIAGYVSTLGNVYSMLPVTGGKMMIGGLFDTVNGIPRKGIARINANGTLDETFEANLFGYNPAVQDMKLDGSNLYIVGDFFKAKGVAVQHIARINLGTSAVDASWAPIPFTPLQCVETDGSYVYIGAGGLRNIDPGSVPVANLARIGKGSPAIVDTTWKPLIAGPNGNPALGRVEDMVFSGSDLIIGGFFYFVVNPTDANDFHQRLCLAKLTTTSWGPPTAGYSEIIDDTVKQLVLYNGSLYIGGDFITINGIDQYFVAKMDPATGAWDNNFFVAPVEVGDPFAGDNVQALTAKNGYIYVSGNFQEVWNGGVGDGLDFSPYIVRVDPLTGIYDPTWYPYPDGSINAMAFQGDDLWVWGLYNEIGGEESSEVAILRPTGTAYQAWVNANFSPSQRSNADFIAPFQDPDGDSYNNYFEFLFNMNPTNSVVQYHTAATGTSGLPLLRLEPVSGSNYLTVEFSRWKSTTDAATTYTPQFATTLPTWSARGVLMSTTSIDANRERVKYRDSIPNLATAFGRVKLTLAP